MGAIFKVDLAEVEWSLSVPCPGCGDALFPDDLSDRHQSLLEIWMEEGVMKAVDRSFTQIPKPGISSENEFSNLLLLPM